MIEYSGKLIVIAGPTASGKSDLAIRLAKEIGGYIINGDSRQVYKHLSIGTAKPVFDSFNDGVGAIEGVEHFLYDFVDPKDDFSLFDYQRSVQGVLDSKKDSGDIPIIVGGTGLYIDSVVYNYDLKERARVSEYRGMGLEELQVLCKDYKGEMNNSDWNNAHRLIRMLERGGKEMCRGEMLDVKYFVIDVDRDTLRERISKRVDIMFDMGLERENRELLDMGYSYGDKGMKSIGYSEFREYFDGKKSLDEVREEIVNHTLQYAKRQRTWFKRNGECIWTDDYDLILNESLNLIKTV